LRAAGIATAMFSVRPIGCAICSSVIRSGASRTMRLILSQLERTEIAPSRFCRSTGAKASRGGAG
jgi:hypothetical protein